jgi:hypothetical protein
MGHMKQRQIDALADAPRHFRGTVARGIRAAESTDRIDADGGEYGAGIIRGAAVITRGEALGHDMWIDNTMLHQVADAINATDSNVKVRFTHPGLSGDGLGKVLGRVYNADVDGDVVRAEVHLLESAHNTPDGDLADYVLRFAEESPELFGMSISFTLDYGEMERFHAEHKDKDGVFHSPDSGNARGLPHVRLDELVATDMVDEPAANPDGLFHRGDEIAATADAYCAYALGLSDDMPESLGGIHPDRARAFFARFMETHGVMVSRVQASTNDEPLTTVAGWKMDANYRNLVLRKRRS